MIHLGNRSIRHSPQSLIRNSNVFTKSIILSCRSLSCPVGTIIPPLHTSLDDNDSQAKPLFAKQEKNLASFSSLALRRKSPSTENSSDHNHLLDPKPRPRLEELRKRLRGKDESISLKKAASSSSKKKASKSPSPSPNNNNSWKDLLALAKLDNLQKKENIESDAMLMDSFSRMHTYLRISLVERCNLRCRYCMPPDGVPLQSEDRLLAANEVDRLVNIFGSNGVDKVRLTGGEPLLRKGIADIISNIATNQSINSIGITTNGVTLSRHLPSLVDAGLTHANISLDTLNDTKFENITRRKGLSRVLRAIEDSCEALPQGNVKVNCVVMKGFNDDELRRFIKMTKDLPLDVRFIEWMPFNNNGWNKNRFLSYADMMDQIESDEVRSPMKLIRDKDGSNDTTKWWRVEGHVGRVGFITSMSEHFCGTCNRIRLTADGQLKVCLFGSAEISLRDAMREGASDEELQFIVKAALQKKKFALGGHGSAEGIEAANDNRPMTLIGG